MCVTNFAKTYNFYTTRFNFAASDVSNALSLLTSFLMAHEAELTLTLRSSYITRKERISPPSYI